MDFQHELLGDMGGQVGRRMELEDFLGKVADQKRVIPWVHITYPGLDKREFDLWKQSYPDVRLPDDWLNLLRHTNGLGIDQQLVYDQFTGPFFTINPLSKIVSATQAIYGERSTAQLPSSWFVIGRDADGEQHLIVDVATFEYHCINAIVPEEAKVIADQFPDCLEWIAQFLPRGDELQRRLSEVNGNASRGL